MDWAQLAMLVWFIESSTEYVLGSVSAVRPYIRWIALGYGVILAVALGIDILAAVMAVPSGPVTVVLSGIMLGSGSSYFHDLLKNFGVKGSSVGK